MVVHRPAAAAPIRPLAWELPYAADVPKNRKEKRERKRERERKEARKERGEGGRGEGRKRERRRKEERREGRKESSLRLIWLLMTKRICFIP